MVARPGAPPTTFPLFDDGLSAHADAEPGDGIYSARFDNYTADGTYSFEVLVENTDGETYIGEQMEVEPGDTPSPVPAFQIAREVIARRPSSARCRRLLRGGRPAPAIHR